MIAPIERWIDLVKAVLASAVRASAMTERDAGELLHRAEHPPDGGSTNARRLLAALADVDRLATLEAHEVALEARKASATIRQERGPHGP